MTSTLRRASIGVMIALASAGVASCSAPAPIASPTSDAGTPTPTATTPAPPVVTAVVLRPDHLELVDAEGGVVDELSYDAPTVELVDALTAVFGSEPELDEHPVGYETPQRDIYRWGGFEVWDDLMGHVEGDTPDTWTWYPDDVADDVDMNVLVMVSAATVGGVDIRTINDVRAGDDFETVAAAIDAETDVVGALLVETGPEIGPRLYPDSPNAYSVLWQVRDMGTSQSVLVAPTNWGVGGA